ncbi:hypothetical protein N658DRAFT_49101 [Parathielavia hyrcaniae]|uniref:Uncharacterized protein n=1 Tax=Parathielavia hyrcaniae TaxID=113614 RepID=A0AAN6T2G4_9PEZI|nr:hypothetical protein N658DRAFT_49101 [Parathielavia hyrcaniae]
MVARTVMYKAVPSRNELTGSAKHRPIGDGPELRPRGSGPPRCGFRLARSRGSRPVLSKTFHQLSPLHSPRRYGHDSVAKDLWSFSGGLLCHPESDGIMIHQLAEADGRAQLSKGEATIINEADTDDFAQMRAAVAFVKVSEPRATFKSLTSDRLPIMKRTGRIWVRIVNSSYAEAQPPAAGANEWMSC